MSSYLKFNGQRDITRALIHWADFGAIGAVNIVMTAFVRFISWPTSGCPVMATEEGQYATGIFVGGADSRSGVVGMAISIQFVGGTYFQLLVSANGADGAGEPFSLGRIYKLELAIQEGATAKLYVDGTEVASQSLFGAKLRANGAGVGLDIGGAATGGAWWGSTEPPRSAHMEVIQAMYEFDRSTAGLFPPSSDSDPFTDLELDASADDTRSNRWLMNDGSGSSATDAEGNYDMSLSSGSYPPSWASDPEPTFSTGAATFDFLSIAGWDLRESDAPTMYPAPVYGPAGPVGDETAGKLRLARTGDHKIEDAEVTTGRWSSTTELSASTSQVFEGNNSLHADGTTTVSSWATLPGAGTITGRWLEWWFYDPGGTSASRVQLLAFSTSGPSPVAGIGFDGSVSTGEYTTFVEGASTEGLASGVAVSTGWHHFGVYIDYAGDVELWIDGSLVRTDSASTLSTISRIVIVHDGESASNDDAFYDAIRVGIAGSTGDAKYEGLVEASGSTPLPLVQPEEGVRFFRGVTIADETAGDSSMDVGGTITYTFRHSTDGGSTWGSSTSLTTANLRALACAGNGQDVLEITVAMTSGMSDIGSPEVSRIRLEYEPATALGEPREVFVTQDQFTLSEAALNG